MKKVLFALFVAFSFSIEAFACGGCNDAFLPPQLTTESLASFVQEEQKTLAKIMELNQVLTEAFNTTEALNLQEALILSALKQNQGLSGKNVEFLLLQNNKLQNISNSIKAQ